MENITRINSVNFKGFGLIFQLLMWLLLIPAEQVNGLPSHNRIATG
jgi:hypothetical protein